MSEFDIDQVVQADFSIDSVLDVQVGTFEAGATIDDSVIALDSTWSSKKIDDELKARAGIAVTGTLEAGETTLTLQSSEITTDSIIDVFTNVYGISPTNTVATTGSVTLTFKAQQTDIGVKVVIINGLV